MAVDLCNAWFQKISILTLQVVVGNYFEGGGLKSLNIIYGGSGGYGYFMAQCNEKIPVFIRAYHAVVI